MAIGQILTQNRKDLPIGIKKKFKSGKSVAFQRGKVLVLKWIDKREVSLLSTVHNQELVSFQKKNKPVEKSKIILKYN